MSDEIRYRVLVIDPYVKNFAASGPDGLKIVGEATAAEIIERLENSLGVDSFDPDRTSEWMEAQDPANAGDAAVLQLNADRELEIIVRSA